MRNTRFRPACEPMEARLALSGDVDPFDWPFAGPMDGPTDPADVIGDDGPTMGPSDPFGPDMDPQEPPISGPMGPGEYLPPLEVGPAGPAM